MTAIRAVASGHNLGEGLNETSMTDYLAASTGVNHLNTFVT
jgi:hypothetical protein